MWDDYENLLYDLGVQRDYLAGYALSSTPGEPLPVLLVESPGWPDSGILILPDKFGRALMAALPPNVWNAVLP